MGDDRIEEFLTSRETGVLSLAYDDQPYSIPVSYGYAASDRRINLRLVSVEDSDKRRFLRTTPPARLVVYAANRITYRSVIVDGTLELIDPEEMTPADVAQYGRTKRPLFEMWNADRTDLDIELFRLEPTSISGRVIRLEE